MKIINILSILIAIIVMASCTSTTVEGPAKVEVKKNESDQYRLYVDGEEFFVLGAGCEGGDVKALAEAGANSFRTWMDQDVRPTEISVLDEAKQNGLKVLMGIKYGRERHGYNYDSTEWVLEQRNEILEKVKAYKDHPALLGWIVGNEINLGTNNMKIYDEANTLSQMIHEIDPNHPTTITLAGIGKKDVDYIKTNCTDIDFLCIQMYGDIVNLQKRIDDAGWDGPYLVTEWGATGHWEVTRTEWDVAIEQTSREKADAFAHRYEVAIEADPVNCMGSYVFLWGQKQERTPTWYGMFLENGAKTETVDVMHKIWSGSWPADRCPQVDSIKLNGLTAYDNVKVKKGDKFNAEVYYANHESDSLTFTWEIIPESTDLGWGGDFESRPETVFHEELGSAVEINVPDTGAYRLFVYVTDDAGNAGTANIPFLVEE